LEGGPWDWRKSTFQELVGVGGAIMMVHNAEKHSKTEMKLPKSLQESTTHSTIVYYPYDP
jgi:hypothetical protein